MGVGMDTGNLLAYILALGALLLIGFILFRIFHIPVKWVSMLVINSIVGGVILFLLNYVFNLLGFIIGVNIVTSSIIGLLGIPGLVMLIVLHFLV